MNVRVPFQEFLAARLDLFGVLGGEVILLGGICEEVEELFGFIIEMVNVLLRPLDARQAPRRASAARHDGPVGGDGTE